MEDGLTYRVVVNGEEQYSIWPERRETPRGWRDAGKTGNREECLAFVKEVWTDMRPASLRKQMAKEVPERAMPAIASAAGVSLVERLSRGEHELEVSRLLESTASALKERLERGYVHITFTGTAGGTELGVRVDRESLDWGGGTDRLHLEGTLTLDYREARLVADIDLATLRGTGRLVVSAEP
jgi:MbtH protein